MLATPDRDPFAFDDAQTLSHCNIALQREKDFFCAGCDNLRFDTVFFATRGLFTLVNQQKYANNHGFGYDLATERELSDFLKSVEKRAFKRSLFHVRDEEAALDIVQDSMMKLAEHYGDKPINELPMLFQRILSNCTLDWFRRQKTRNALFSNMSDFEGPDDDGDFDLLEIHNAQNGETEQSAEDHTNRKQTLALIEKEIQELPARQREAFLMRYWEEMDIAETAAAMGCSEGSVKTHCFRAIQTLSKVLKAKGIVL